VLPRKILQLQIETRASNFSEGETYMKLIIIGILGMLIATSANAARISIHASVDLPLDTIFVSEESAEKLYNELLSFGAAEKFYPELPGPSDVKYLPVKEISHKNVSCLMSQYNSNYEGALYGMPRETIFQCKIRIEKIVPFQFDDAQVAYIETGSLFPHEDLIPLNAGDVRIMRP
jgi:hypothetical protein